jgi:hypothetical protein
MSSPCAAGRLHVCVVAPFGVLSGTESWPLRLLDATGELAPRAVLLVDGPLRTKLERRGIPVTVRAVGRTAAQQLAAMAGWRCGCAASGRTSCWPTASRRRWPRC